MFKRGNFLERSIMGALSFLKGSVFADACATKRGFLQAQDPRLKTIGILLLLLTVLFCRDIFFLAMIYGLTLVLACASSLNLVFFLKRTWFFIPLFSLAIAIPALFNVFTPGEPLVSFRTWGLSFSITRQGLNSASLLVARVMVSVSLTVLLALTTKHNQLLKVLRIFKVPQVFVMALGMCYRYIYLFVETIENTYTAIKSRVGAPPKVKEGQSLVAWNIGQLWQRSYYINLQVYDAMLSRGYQGEPIVLDEFKTRPQDWAWLASVVIFFAGVIWKQFLR